MPPVKGGTCERFEWQGGRARDSRLVWYRACSLSAHEHLAVALKHGWSPTPESEDLMLDAYIIDQMRRDEIARQHHYEQPCLRLPAEPYHREEQGGVERDEESSRVVVIDLLED